ncbi:MAG: Chemotaxis protein CheV [Labilithrix sp.]|jgi:CheY-like chemotaxis protein|nr:Chemotaxis protein CheV [Labilithrix sp.]
MTESTSPPVLVLVVDDTEDNRAIFGLCLEDGGFEVAYAFDGEDALAKVESEKPALIIMDLAMPRMDGWEATRRIKANPATKHIPVLVVTGTTTGDAVARAKDSGADDVCMKPCRAEELLAKVRGLLA